MLSWFEADVEITLEANPGTVEQQRFADFREAGVNRLSIGVQSFNQEHLRKLGRIHSGEQALQAIATTKSVGFDNFNIDVNFGLKTVSREVTMSSVSGETIRRWYFGALVL